MGIYGLSGSGKSTFLDILLGLFSPNSGNIIIDGKNQSLNSKSWRNKIGYIPQNVNLLDDNILVNISLEKDLSKINLQYINQIIINCELDSFVKNLSNGTQSNLGERGSRISGGENRE